MEHPETSQIVGDEVNAFSLIDVSASDDDFLLASSSEASIVDNRGDVLAGGARISQQPDSMELQKPRKNGKCNLRKSLAWDSAFFTSAGVLEPEELSSIMEGAEGDVKQKHFLPGIEEDLSKSTDSISTFESDLTLESLEADLFSDIRASIQRCNRISTLGNCNGTKFHEVESKNGCTMKKVNPSSDVMKPKLVSKKLNPGVQGPLKSLKPGSGCKPLPKPAVRSRESSTLLPRPPEAAGKKSLIGAAATKRMSVGAGCVKLEGKGASSPKAAHQAESRSTAPKTMAASKFSSGSLALSRVAICSSRSSCDSSSSSSSENIRKSQSDVVRRRMEKNTNLPPGSKIRTPSKVPVKSKSQTGDSKLSDFLKSTTKLSSSISLASSISEWSTESSSSTATVKQKHIGLKPGPRSSENIIVDRIVSQNPESDSSNKAFGRQENPVVGMLNQSTKQSSIGTAVSSRPGSAKPSGLRLPSAKIGFFDGVKAGAKTPNASSCSRSMLPSSLPRSTAGICTPSGSGSKKKPENTAAKVNPTVAGTATPEPCRMDAKIRPVVHLEGFSTVLQKSSNAENVDNVSDISCKLPESGSNYVGKNGNVAEVVDEGKHVADSGQMEKASLGGKLHSTNDQASFAEDGFNTAEVTDCTKNLSANPSTKVEERNINDNKDIHNLNPLTGVSEADDLKFVSIQACQDSSYVTMDPTQDTCAENQVNGQDKCMEVADIKMVMKRETYDFQSQNVVCNEKSSCSTLPSCPEHLCDEKQTGSAQSVNFITCTLPLPCLGSSPGTRTPFAVKNSGSDMVEACNSSSGSAIEALVKVNGIPSVQEAQKENS